MEQTKRWSLFLGGVALLLIAVFALFKLGETAFAPPNSEAVTLSVVVLVGLALVVILMAALGIDRKSVTGNRVIAVMFWCRPCRGLPPSLTHSQT